MDKKTPHPARPTRKPETAEIDAIRDALYASKIIAYAQGFEQMSVASAQFHWDLKLGDMATIWRGGCIIRARFLDRIKEAYDRNAKLSNLLLDDYFRQGVARAEDAWRRVLALAVANGVPTPAFSSALAYYDGLSRARGPANLLQGLRDYFGAHTYRRLDKDRQFPYPLGSGRGRGQGLAACSRNLNSRGAMPVRGRVPVLETIIVFYFYGEGPAASAPQCLQL